MVAVAYAGMDYRALLHSDDEVEIAVTQVVAEGVIEHRQKVEEQRDINLAARIGNSVGKVVGQALSSALQAIARAMRS